MTHATTVDGIPLIGIDPKETLEECDLCHDLFHLLQIQLEGTQFLCLKCRTFWLPEKMLMKDKMKHKVKAGQIFDMLTVLLDAQGVKTKVQCRCACGKLHYPTIHHLLAGDSGSCGCRRLTANRHSKTKVYRVWNSMKERCYNPKHKLFKHYGGRGISVCDRWLDFRNFESDMGPRPMGHTIERINNDKGYSPDNCKWATQSEQSRNRQDTVKITAAGKTLCLADWNRILGKPTYLNYHKKRGHDLVKLIESNLNA